MLTKSWVAASVLLLSGMGFHTGGVDGIHRHDVSEEAHRNLGADTAFQSVCRIEKNDSPSDSCVLIAPGWVLTAGHTVHLATDQRLSVIFADSAIYSVEQREIHPEFVWGVDFGVDLALLRLDRAVDGIRPAVPYRGSPTIGNRATLVGWGVFGSAHAEDSELLPSGHVRAAGYNMIDSIGGLTPQSEQSNGYVIMDFDAPGDPSMNILGSADALPLEFAFTGGDSGGGVFIEVNGQMRLLAIISLSEHSNSSRQTRGRYGTKMFAARLGGNLSWIDEVTGQTAGSPGEQAATADNKRLAPARPAAAPENPPQPGGSW